MKKSIVVLSLLGALSLSACSDEYYFNKAEKFDEKFGHHNLDLLSMSLFALSAKDDIKNLEKALEYYNKAIEKNPDVAKYYSKRAWANFKLSKIYFNLALHYLNSAIADIQKVIEISPDDAFNYYSLSYFKNYYFSLHNNGVNKDFSDIDKAIELDYKNAMYYAYRGNRYLSIFNLYGDSDAYKKALADFNKAIELQSDNFSYYNLMASLLVSGYEKGINKNLDEINKNFNYMLKYAKDEKESISAISGIMILAFRYNLPSDFTDKVVNELIVNLPDNLKYYVYMHFMNMSVFDSRVKNDDKNDKMEKMLSDGLKYASDNEQKFNLYLSIINYYNMVNNDGKLKELYEEQLKYADDLSAKLDIKYKLLSLRPFDEVIDDYKSLLDETLKSEKTLSVASSIVNSFISNNDSEKYNDLISDMIDKIIDKYPNNSEGYYLKLDEEQGDYIENMEKIAEIENKPYSYSSLASAYLKAKDYDKALDTVNKAIKLCDKDNFPASVFYEKKSDILLAMNKADEAVIVLQEAISLYPRDLKRFESKIDEIRKKYNLK